jgi:outer membrane lipoprotein carrier protein
MLQRGAGLRKIASDFQSTRSALLPRQPFVTPSPATRALLCALPYFVACACLTGTVMAAPQGTDKSVDALLKNIETRYNHPQSLKLDFSETYAGMKSPVQKESGVLYLRKPGRMRWDYTAPAGKIFISDGKEVFIYTPNDHQAEKSKLRESEDVHAPLAMLLGKLNFAKEFKSFQARHEPGDAAGETWITAEPKSENLAWSKVDFLVTTEGQLRRVRITLQDHSTLDFSFSNEQLNIPVAESLFTFHPPPGVQIVEAGQ